jgi:ribosomal protein S26
MLKKDIKKFNELIEYMKNEDENSFVSADKIGKLYNKDKNIIVNGINSLIENKKDKELELFTGNFLFSSCKDLDENTMFSMVKYCLNSDNRYLQRRGITLINSNGNVYDFSCFEGIILENDFFKPYQKKSEKETLALNFEV